MADVELVIKISEKVYNALTHIEFDANLVTDEMRKSIANCTPLPKGHGRLIDAREYENDIRKHYFDNSTVIRCTEIALENTPTIIEADKAESEDKA